MKQSDWLSGRKETFRKLLIGCSHKVIFFGCAYDDCLYVFKLITLKPRAIKWNYIHIIHRNVVYKLKSQVTSLQSERVKSSWFVIVCYVFTANKNKDKEMKVKACTDELKEIKDMTTEVLHVFKSTNRSNPGDPGSMISVLKELQLALGTFFEQL